MPVPELRDPVVLVETAVAAYHEDDVSSEDLLVHYESNLGVRRAVAVLPLEFPQRNLHMIARTLSTGPPVHKFSLYACIAECWI